MQASTITVHLPATLKGLTAQQSTVTASGNTLGAVIDDLEQQYPGLAAHLLQEGKIARYLNLYLNERDVRFGAQLASEVKEGDELVILSAMAGGSPARA